MTTSPRICASCATSNPPQAAFCFGCGKPLSSAPSTAELLHQRYHLLHPLGSGGFGSVYQAEDIQLGKRLVAVKEMRPQNNLSAQENADAAEAFRKEALLLAELMHPNLPRIYDHFSENERWYLVMDCIEGETLEDYLAKLTGASVPLEEALEMGLQLCDVLDYLHTRQPPIIFRDLKPLNIMRTATGHLYLIDFGIARHFKPGQAKDTVAFGSPGYAAPEQYGKAQTTPRADIYSLGAVLHQLLSGADPSLNPFRFAPLRLPAGKPTPQALAELVAKMLEMDETKRPTSVSEIKAALREIATQVASGSFVTVEPGVTAVAMVSRIPIPSGTLRSTYRGKYRQVRALAWSPDSKLIVSAGESNVIDVWTAKDGIRVQGYARHTDQIRGVSWSPDGEYIASAGEDRTVHVWDARTGQTIRIYTGHDRQVTGVAWSPDSRCIASCSLDKSVQVWDVATGYCYVTYTRHREVVYRVVWSPDGASIASTGYGGDVHVWQAMSGKQLLIYEGHALQVLALAWSPDSRVLASGGADASLQVWEAASGRVQQSYSCSGAPIASASWSPDGLALVSGGDEDQVRVWARDTGKQIFAYAGHVAPLPQPTKDPYDPSMVWQWLHPSRAIITVAWSPDGHWIASSDNNNTIHVWGAD